MDTITIENSQLTEQVQILQKEMDKLRQENIILKQRKEDSSVNQTILTNAELKGKVWLRFIEI